MVFTHRSFADMFVDFLFICFVLSCACMMTPLDSPVYMGDLSESSALWSDAGWSTFFVTLFVAFSALICIWSLCFFDLF